jgi:hypothetical protein
MKSLKENLLSLLRAKGTLSYADAVSYSISEGYKVDNMTRRMRELCHEQPIVPITAISKRNTEYISGWKLKFEEINYVNVDNKNDRGKLQVCFIDTLPPAFASKEIKKEHQSPLFP